VVGIGDYKNGAPIPVKAGSSGINDGPAAGQTISHAHIHIIPRYEGDVSDPRGGVRWVIPEKAEYWNIKKELI